MSTYTSAELGLAFGVCIGAGLSTTIGAALVLFRCINEMNHRLLAVCLVGGVRKFCASPSSQPQTHNADVQAHAH